MKYAKIFAIFVMLHLAAWIGTHVYASNSNNHVLIVVDTSFSMKTKFPKIRQWIDDYESQNRYKKILIGTDKAMLGEITQLPSKDVIFRKSFGKLQESNLKRHYGGEKVKQKILLSDGSIQPSDWETVEF